MKGPETRMMVPHFIPNLLIKIEMPTQSRNPFPQKKSTIPVTRTKINRPNQNPPQKPSANDKHYIQKPKRKTESPQDTIKSP